MFYTYVKICYIKFSVLNTLCYNYFNKSSNARIRKKFRMQRICVIFGRGRLKWQSTVLRYTSTAFGTSWVMWASFRDDSAGKSRMHVLEKSITWLYCERRRTRKESNIYVSEIIFFCTCGSPVSECIRVRLLRWRYWVRLPVTPIHTHSIALQGISVRPVEHP